MTELPGLEIRLLGAPRARVDGRPLEVDTRKAVAVLAVLALQPGPQSRERLAALLWPESDEEHARSALRRTLSTLNRALGGRWVVIRRDVVELPGSDDCRVDVRAFREGIAAGRAGDIGGFERAVEAYGDDLMAGFALRDCAEFEEWLEPQIEELRRDYTSALERLIEGACGQGRFDEAERLAGLWLRRDPLNERAHQWRMKAAAWNGDRSAALGRYRDCVRILDGELGVTPVEETTALYLAIREGSLPPPSATASPPSRIDRPEAEMRPAGAGQPVDAFVGRAAELGRLGDLFGGAKGSGQVALIEGEAGVGKTRLIDEFLAVAGAGAWRVRCYPGESALAFVPIRMLLELATENAAADLPERARREAARIVDADGGEPGGPLDSAGAQLRFFAGVGEVLARGAGGLLVVIDDAQWIDNASAELLGYLLRRPREYVLRVIIGLRPDDAGPGAERLRESVLDAGGEVLLLQRLAREEVELWVKVSKVNAAPAIVSRIDRESEGLPLLIREYTAMLAAGGLDEGEWSIPVRAREVLGARLRSLGELDQQLVTAASAIGRPFTFDEVRVASGRSEDEALGALERLLARRLLVENQRSRAAAEWEFTHEKLRELAYESMTATRRRLVHRRLAQALRGQCPAAEVALHFELGGLEREAAENYFAAAEEARAIFANREALKHYGSALGMGYPQAARVHQAMGDIHLLTGEFEQALTDYETSAALSSGPDLRRLEHTLGRVYMRLGDVEQADDRFEAALAAPFELADDERALILADRALLAYKRDDRERARALTAEVVAMARDANSVAALARAQIVLGIIARRDGKTAEARAALEEGLRLAGDSSTPELRASALNALALATAEAGDVGRAIELGTLALALCEEQGDRQRAAAIHSNLADFHHGLGDREAAMRHLEASVAVFGEIGVVSGVYRPEVWKLVDW